MRITESRLRKIIRGEAGRVNEKAGNDLSAYLESEREFKVGVADAIMALEDMIDNEIGSRNNEFRSAISGLEAVYKRVTGRRIS